MLSEFYFLFNLWATLFRFLGHTFPDFGSHFSGFWVTLFRFLGHTFPVFRSHFSGFWVTLFRFLGHTFPVFGSSIVPARPRPIVPGHTFPVCLYLTNQLGGKKNYNWRLCGGEEITTCDVTQAFGHVMLDFPHRRFI